MSKAPSMGNLFGGSDFDQDKGWLNMPRGEIDALSAIDIAVRRVWRRQDAQRALAREFHSARAQLSQLLAATL